MNLLSYFVLSICFVTGLKLHSFEKTLIDIKKDIASTNNFLYAVGIDETKSVSQYLCNLKTAKEILCIAKTDVSLAVSFLKNINLQNQAVRIGNFDYLIYLLSIYGYNDVENIISETINKDRVSNHNKLIKVLIYSLRHICGSSISGGVGQLKEKSDNCASEWMKVNSHSINHLSDKDKEYLVTRLSASIYIREFVVFITSY